MFVSMSPEVDAYRIFMSTLGLLSTDEPPNVAVVHIASMKEKAALSDRLGEAEREAGVGKLPLMVIVAPGQDNKLNGFAGDRPRLVVHSPTPVARLVKALNAMATGSAMKSAA